SVLRAHSSAETMTAAGFPLRVIVCGLAWARSTTSDSRAFAVAKVQPPSDGGEAAVFLLFAKAKPSMTIMTTMTSIVITAVPSKWFRLGMLLLAFVFLCDLIINESEIAKKR